MKKKLILLAGIAIAMAACTKNELRDDSAQTEPVSWPSVITVATEPVVDSETKSDIASDGTFSWYAGAGETAEKLDINTDAGFKVYTCTDAASGTFGGDLEGATPSTVAVYPAGQYALSTKTLTVTMPASYEYVAKLAKTPMIAQISGSIDNLAFKHIAALLKVSIANVPPTATQLVLETDENIAGAFVISDCTVADAAITNAGGSGNSVTVNFAAAGVFTDKDFFIPIPTGTYAHFNLFLKDENGNKLAGRQFAGKTIERKDLASGDAISLPQLQLSDAIVLNDTQIGLRWSENAFATTSAAVTADKDPAYTFGIYRDAACTSKLWDWETAKNAAVFTSTPGHVFSGLTPETTYYIKVKDATKGVAAVKAFTTTAAETNFVKSDAAAADDVILYENFDDIIYGTDYVHRLTGVANNWTDALGRPDVSTNKELAAAASSDRNLLTNAHESTSSVGYNYLNSKPLFNWSSYYGANGTRENQYPTIAVGGLRFGGSNRTGYIVSPTLESLTTNAVVTVKVTAGAQSAGKKLYVAVFPACDVTGTYRVIGTAPINEYEVAEVSARSFTEYSIDVTVPAGGRIGVGTKFGGSVTELFVDKIEAVYKSAGPALLQSLVFSNDTQIGVRWSVTGFATPTTDVTKNYTFGIYTDAACTSPVYTPWTAKVSSVNSQSPGYVFSGLTASTSYYVRIVNNTDSAESIVEYTTAVADPNFVLGTTASEGDKILNQNFNEMKWAGEDYVNSLAGYKFSDWSTHNVYGDPDGTNYSLVYSGAMSILANAVEKGKGGNNGAKWFEASTLKDWLFYPTVPPSNCGSLRFGAAGYLVSPKLECLTGSATVKVTVTVAGNSNNDDKLVDIAVFDSDPTVGTGAKYNTIDNTIVSPVRTQRISSIKSYKKGWTSYSVNITIGAGQRIGVGASATTGFWLDDIKVELVSYDD